MSYTAKLASKASRHTDATVGVELEGGVASVLASFRGFFLGGIFLQPRGWSVATGKLPQSGRQWRAALTLYGRRQ